MTDFIIHLEADSPEASVFAEAQRRGAPLSLLAYVVGVNGREVTLRSTGRPVVVVTNLKDGKPFPER